MAYRTRPRVTTTAIVPTAPSSTPRDTALVHFRRLVSDVDDASYH